MDAVPECKRRLILKRFLAKWIPVGVKEPVKIRRTEYHLMRRLLFNPNENGVQGVRPAREFLSRGGEGPLLRRRNVATI